MSQTLQLTVGSYNIHKAVGRNYRRDPQRTLSVIHEVGADIMALQEVDRRFGDRRGVLDLQALKQATGLTPIPVGTRLAELAHGWHGNMILAKGALLEDARVITLPGLEPRGAIIADLSFGGVQLRVIAAHFGLLKGSRLSQAKRLVAEIGADRPTLMMGDLNEWRKGGECSLMPLKTALNAVQTADTVASFPAQRPTLSLDRIIGCNRAAVCDLATHNTALARQASDHLPIRARIRLSI